MHFKIKSAIILKQHCSNILPHISPICILWKDNAFSIDILVLLFFLILLQKRIMGTDHLFLFSQVRQIIIDPICICKLSYIFLPLVFVSVFFDSLHKFSNMFYKCNKYWKQKMLNNSRTKAPSSALQGEPTKTSKLGKEKHNKPLPCLSQFGEVPP